MFEVQSTPILSKTNWWNNNWECACHLDLENQYLMDRDNNYHQCEMGQN